MEELEIQNLMKERFGHKSISENGVLQFLACIINNVGLTRYCYNKKEYNITEFGKMFLYVLNHNIDL